VGRLKHGACFHHARSASFVKRSSRLSLVVTRLEHDKARRTFVAGEILGLAGAQLAKVFSSLHTHTQGGAIKIGLAQTAAGAEQPARWGVTGNAIGHSQGKRLSTQRRTAAHPRED